MNPEQENADKIRKLLALKRHEQPPPGYFQQFPSRVMSRLEASQDSSVFSWLANIWNELMNRPVFSGAVGVVTAITLLVGLFHSQGDQNTAAAPFFAANTPSTANGGPDGGSKGLAGGFETAANDNAGLFNTNLPLSSGSAMQPSLFNSPSLQIQKANYRHGSY